MTSTSLDRSGSLEPQIWPDASNRPDFLPARLNPDLPPCLGLSILDRVSRRSEAMRHQLQPAQPRASRPGDWTADRPQTLHARDGPGALDGAVVDAEGRICCASSRGTRLHVHSPE